MIAFFKCLNEIRFVMISKIKRHHLLRKYRNGFKMYNKMTGGSYQLVRKLNDCAIKTFPENGYVQDINLA